MIGIIAAMDVEINDLIASTDVKETVKKGMFTFHRGILKGREIVILKCGIGKVAASFGAALMIQMFEPEVIINTGIAGGACGVSVSDVVLTKSLSYGDVDVRHFGYSLGQIPQMPCKFEADEVLLNKVSKALERKKIAYKLGHALTFDSFITTLKNREVNLEEVTICEMEGTAIAQTCYMANIPFLGVRYVSDIVDSASQIENYKVFETQMAHLSSAIIKEIITLI